MNTICYRLDVKETGFEFSVPAGSSEKEAFEIYSVFKEHFPESSGYSVEVFKIETIEKKLITENWKA
jgi:hypothetical protein